MSNLINGRVSGFEALVGLENQVDITVSEMHIYVDPVNGSDGNKGLSSSEPVKSLNVGIGMVPDIIKHDVFVHLAAGTYTPVDISDFVWAGGNLVIVGDEYNVIHTDTADSGSTASSIVGTGFTENEYIGYSIEFTSGTLKGQRRTLSRNTTTSLVPLHPFSGAPSTGDDYRIFIPESVLEYKSDTFTIFEGPSNSSLPSNIDLPSRSQPSLVLLNIGFEGDSSITFNNLIGIEGRVVFVGVFKDSSSQKNPGLSIYGSLYSGADSSTDVLSYNGPSLFIDNEGLLNYFNISSKDWVGWGYGTGSPFSGAGFAAQTVGGFMAGFYAGISPEFGLGSKGFFLGVCITDQNLIVSTNAVVRLYNKVDIIGGGISSTNGGVAEVREGLTYFDCTGNNSVCYSYGGSWLYVSGMTSGNASTPDHTLWAEHGGQIQVNFDPNGLSYATAAMKAGAATSNSLSSADSRLIDSNASPDGSLIYRHVSVI